ncbi:MAG: beta-ketoacyl-[acyl-carrier-protein] synthase family protein [Casimicrobiaceae bacterium]
MNERFVPLAASTLVNACGAGWPQVRQALHGNRGGLRYNDFAPAAELDTWIGRVDGIEELAMPGALAAFDCRNHRLALLCLEQDGFIEAVRGAATRHGRERIGVFVGTSTSGILATELAFRAQQTPGAPVHESLSPAFYRYRHSMFAVTEFVRTVLGLRGPAMTVSTACSSSAKVFAQAARAIAAGVCDAAVVGGVDSLALSTLYGFHSLALLSRQPCRPFDAGRDGISIGEAAGFALLDPAVDAKVGLTGYGESSDAYHMSSPHPEGAGAVAAMREALVRAGVDAAAIDYVNMHGTASRANDEIEDLAVAAVFGARPSVSSTKGWTGHTLGAAGATEALISAMTLEDGWIPGTLNCRSVDPKMKSRIELTPPGTAPRIAMSNSFGFGGNNCSLVFGLRA